jgi:hypothetical protein
MWWGVCFGVGAKEPRMKVRSSFKGGVATLFLDVRNQDGSLDRAAWRAIQTDHDKGWQQVGLWALRFKGFQRDLNSALDWHFDPCPYVATFSVRAMQMPDVLVRPKTGVLQKKVPVSENPKTLGSRQSPLLTQALNEAKGINALRSAFRLMCASSSSGKVQNETVNKEAVRHVVIAVLNRMQSGQERSRYAVDKAMSVSWCFQILGIANPLIQHRIAEMTGANALVYERVDSERYPTYYIYTHLDRLRVHEFLSWAYEAGIRNEELTDVISQSQGGDISKDGEETTSNETDTTASRDEDPETEETREPPKSLSEIRREIAANNRGTPAQVKESNESKFVLSIENGVATGSIRLSPTQLRELNGPRTDVLHRYRNWGFRYLRYKGYVPCDVNSFQPIWNDSHKRLEFVAEVRPMADGEIGVEQRMPKPEKEASRSTLSYKYGDFSLLTGRSPVSLSVGTDVFPLRFWRDVLVATCDAIAKVDVDRLRAAALSGGMSLFADNAAALRRPRRHEASGLFFETNADAVHITRQSWKLFQACGFDLGTIQISFCGRESVSSEEARSETDAEDKGGNETIVEPTPYDEIIAKVLEIGFTNGMRPDSFIDQKKMSRLCSEQFGTELPEGFDFKRTLSRIGISLNGKVFPKPSHEHAKWRALIDRLVAEGNHIFRFSLVMRTHGAELMDCGITSTEMLRETVFQTASEAFSVYGDFFAPKGFPVVPDVVIASSVPSNVTVIVVERLSKSLPYLEKSDITDFLKRSPQYCWNSVDSYVNVDLIDFEEGEITEGIRSCRQMVRKEDVFSLAQLDLSVSKALNPSALQMSVMRQVFFVRFLSDDFDLHGQIVSRKGTDVDAYVPIRNLCRNNVEVSIRQAEEAAKANNLTVWRTIATLHEEMVRVDEERFVRPDFVDFDRDAIDLSISRQCIMKVIPMGMINDFSDFPAVTGYSWNSYLLESFLRRESSEFELRTASVATKDVSGVIVRRDADVKDWADVFAWTAIDAGIKPEVELVGDFLITNRCILRRRTPMLNEIVSKMNELLRNMK